MLQVPLIELTKCLKGSQTGNVIFWLSIMLGQPLIVLLYARDYAQGLYGPWTDADTKTVRLLHCFLPALSSYRRGQSFVEVLNGCVETGW